MRELRLTKAKQFAQGHRVRKPTVPELEPGSLQLQASRDLTKVTRETGAGAARGPGCPSPDPRAPSPSAQKPGAPTSPRGRPQPLGAPPGPAAAGQPRPARAGSSPPACPPRGPRGPRPAGPTPPPDAAALTAVADDEQLEEVVVVPGHGGRRRRARAGGVGAGLGIRSSLRAASAAADPLPEQTAGTDRNTSLLSPSSSSSSSAAAAAAAASLLPAPPRQCADAAFDTAFAQPQPRPAAPSPRSRTAQAPWPSPAGAGLPSLRLVGERRRSCAGPWGLGERGCCGTLKGVQSAGEARRWPGSDWCLHLREPRALRRRKDRHAMTLEAGLTPSSRFLETRDLDTPPPSARTPPLGCWSRACGLDAQAVAGCPVLRDTSRLRSAA